MNQKLIETNIRKLNLLRKNNPQKLLIPLVIIFSIAIFITALLGLHSPYQLIFSLYSIVIGIIAGILIFSINSLIGFLIHSYKKGKNRKNGLHTKSYILVIIDCIFPSRVLKSLIIILLAQLKNIFSGLIYCHSPIYIFYQSSPFL